MFGLVAAFARGAGGVRTSSAALPRAAKLGGGGGGGEAGGGGTAGQGTGSTASRTSTFDERVRRDAAAALSA